MSGPDLVLRDLHMSSPPSLWPPAPGWWMLAAILAGVVALVWWWRWRARTRKLRYAQLFDASLMQATTPGQEMTVMSELLRRAARRQHPGAGTLHGDAWLRLLDEGMQPPVFVDGAGSMLELGLYQPHVDAEALAALRSVARERFVRWMMARR